MFSLAGIQNPEDEAKGRKNKPPYLHYLLKEKINTKCAMIQRVLKEGPPNYDDEQRRAIVMRNVERKLKLGEGSTLNLQQLKIDTISEIAVIERIKESDKISKAEDK